MARIALVSRNPAMSMGLSATKHSVVEIRPSNLEAWIESEDHLGFDALVLDLGSPQVASRVVGDLRAASHWIPVLLVTGSDSSWAEDSVAELPNVRQLSFPVDPAKLQAAVEQVLSLPKSQPPVPAPSVDRDAPVVVSEGVSNLPVLDPVQDLDNLTTPSLLALSEPEPLIKPEPTAPEVATMPEVATPPPKHQRVPEPEPPQVAKSTRSPAKSRSRPSSKNSTTKRKSDESAPLRLDPSEPPLPVPTSAPSAAPNSSGAPFGLDPLHALLTSVDSMYTLQETATVIVDDAVVRSRADAGALLVPDGTIWRVAAGVAIRPLEYRLQLSGDAWIIENVATAGKGIIIEDSDVVRQALRGSPLASRPHLMAVPVPAVRAVVILARDGTEAFREATLGPLADLARESGPLLQEALDLRSLARSLARHLDSER